MGSGGGNGGKGAEAEAGSGGLLQFVPLPGGGDGGRQRLLYFAEGGSCLSVLDVGAEGREGATHLRLQVCMETCVWYVSRKTAL